MPVLNKPGGLFSKGVHGKCHRDYTAAADLKRNVAVRVKRWCKRPPGAQR